MPRHGSDEGIGHAENIEGLPDQNKHSSIRNKRSNHKSSLSWKEVAQWMKLSGWRKQLSVCVIKICLVALSWLSRKLTQAWSQDSFSLVRAPIPCLWLAGLLSSQDVAQGWIFWPQAIITRVVSLIIAPARSPARVVLKLSFLATSKSFVPQANFTRENTSWNPKKYCKWFLTSCRYWEYNDRELLSETNLWDRSDTGIMYWGREWGLVTENLAPLLQIES